MILDELDPADPLGLAVRALSKLFLADPRSLDRSAFGLADPFGFPLSRYWVNPSQVRTIRRASWLASLPILVFP